MKTKQEIALEVLEYSRSCILVKMPFLNKALFSLNFSESNDINFATDGINIYYNSNYIINQYRENDEYFVKGIFHILLHFSFHHNLIGDNIDVLKWNLACDIAVEKTISSLKIDLKNDFELKQHEIFDYLQNNISSYNAENIYKYYLKLDLKDEDIKTLRYYFFYDEHGTWFYGKKEAKITTKWEELSKQIQTDLQTYHKDNAKYLVENLIEINRHKMTLKYFLSRFGKIEEEVKTSQEDIDIMLYTYGLNLYKNIALVDNLEYKEDKKIKDLVIAIDTSGSVKGELVTKFVEYTYSLLSDEKYLSNQMNLFIIQCDDKIQEIKQIKSKEDFDKYLNNLQLKGFGETDFRPVFECVNNLINEHKIVDLKGLIYFTDGIGSYPMKKQNYPTAFVIYQKKYQYIKVPSWCLKIELLEDDILDEKFD